MIKNNSSWKADFGMIISRRILNKQKLKIMRKTILLSSIAVMFCVLTVSAQKSGARGSSYETALGVKFYPGAVTLKHFIKSDFICLL